MNEKWHRVIAAIVGFDAGILSSRTMFATSWTALIFWAVVGLVLGCFTLEREKAVSAGAIYGFFLSISFLLGTFGGTADQLLGFLMLTLLLSFLGMLGGVIACVCGWWINRLVRGRVSKE